MSSKNKVDQVVIEKIISSLENIKYGSVQITVHDSRVTQIETGEKIRIS